MKYNKLVRDKIPEILGDPEELADVLEVVEALKKLPDYENVEELRKKKFEERGGFEKRIILKGDK